MNAMRLWVFALAMNIGGIASAATPTATVTNPTLPIQGDSWDDEASLPRGALALLQPSTDPRVRHPNPSDQLDRENFPEIDSSPKDDSRDGCEDDDEDTEVPKKPSKSAPPRYDPRIPQRPWAIV